jgi:hypothetical protein
MNLSPLTRKQTAQHILSVRSRKGHASTQILYFCTNAHCTPRTRKGNASSTFSNLLRRLSDGCMHRLEWLELPDTQKDLESNFVLRMASKEA